MFVTKGDPIGAFDPPIPYSAVLGRVVRIKWPAGDFRLDTWRGRWTNRTLATVSRATGWMYRTAPFKGVLKRCDGLLRFAWRLVASPSHQVRKINERMNTARRIKP